MNEENGNRRPSRTERLREILLGAAREPFDTRTRRQMALVAFFAWVGLGADGLSSANYGPAEAFIALGQHTELGLFVAAATVLTVFVIALGYHQVIELFPNGGGGYKIATQLLGPYAGLVSGCALVVDYMLTITISIAAGIDALFSLLPYTWSPIKMPVAAMLIIILAWLNLRGVKETIKLLLPVFIGFLLTHGGLVIYGLVVHAKRLPHLVPDSLSDAGSLADAMGPVFLVSVILRAYSLGAGTYTGIEAVSNNVQVLAEPRVRTGKITMLYMALSLAFMAAGLMLLYLLLEVSPQPGETLNATAFRAMMSDWRIVGWPVGGVALISVLVFAAGLLFVAANTGFLGGPAVLANMATDQWTPRQFRHLSSRLVTHFGIVCMAAAALALLLVTKGRVDVLVVLYSVNVFIAFTLCLLGLCVFWLRQRRTQRHWRRRLALSSVGFIFAGGILCTLVIEKFETGAWISLLLTGLLAAACVLIRRHYLAIAKRLWQLDSALRMEHLPAVPPAIVAADPAQPTAVLFLGPNYGAGMHTLLTIERLFPNHFKTFVFVTVGEVDARSLGGTAARLALQREVQSRLDEFARFCHASHRGAAAYKAFGTDVVHELSELAELVSKDFPRSVFFAPRLIGPDDNWLTRLLHNQTAVLLQRRLHRRGIQMMVVPMKLN